MDESKRDPNWFWTFFVGLIGTIILVLIVVGLQTWFYIYEKDELLRKVYSKENAELVSLIESQETALANYAIIDPSSGVAAIPIELAMEKVVQESGSR